MAIATTIKAVQDSLQENARNITQLKHDIQTLNNAKQKEHQWAIIGQLAHVLEREIVHYILLGRDVKMVRILSLSKLALYANYFLFTVFIVSTTQH